MQTFSVCAKIKPYHINMKKSLLRNLLLILLLTHFAFLISCKKDDEIVIPKNAALNGYLKDSTIIADSLKRINSAGIINYTVAVVNGNSSALFRNNAKLAGQASQKEVQTVLTGAVVTATQYGRTQVDTTDESGLAMLTGFFRGGINITIRKEGFTTITYIAHVSSTEETENNTIRWMGNIIPIFELAGERTSTITGKVTVETNLTNITRELAPSGTAVTASIHPTTSFYEKFLKLNYASGDASYFGGEIASASYETGVAGAVNEEGMYSVTVPGAIAGLPIKLNFSDIAADQTVFETGDPNVDGGFNRIKTYRNLFRAFETSPTAVPAAGGAMVFFLSGSGAEAVAAISGDANIERINITNGGTGYTVAPKVQIVGGSGSGATATATVTNGVVTDITLDNQGSGYTSTPTVMLISGTGATASTTIGGGGKVLAVIIKNSGNGYTTAPAVTFSAPALAGGVTATGTAVVSGGKVTEIKITEAGSGYTGAATITIGAAPAGGIDATAETVFSGQSVESVQIIDEGMNYIGAPTVTFSAPDVAGGVRATGTAIVDIISGIVTGIQIKNAGSGYLAAPTVMISAGSGASAEAVFLGRGLTGIEVIAGGTDYVTAPVVKITGGDGSGAEATAVIANGKVIGVTIDNPGSGYTTEPTIEFISGNGAQASVTVENGRITVIDVVNGGFGYTGAPTIKIEAIPGAPGSGATAIAKVDNGKVTSVNITDKGTGYIGGNVPSVSETFVIRPDNSEFIDIYPGLTYIRDVHYGTGVKQND